MKKVLLLFFALWGCMLSSFGQVTFKIDGFSDRYYGRAYLSDTSEVFSEGWVAVYDRKTNKKLIHVDADELSFDLHDHQLKANIAEIPYGEHSVLLYEDFNFDGKNDFALMDGQHGCYHGPSYQIFLASNNGFTFSPGFTKLAQENCGMFSVNEEEKTISTMTKDGYGWHKFSTYIVKDNEPFLISTLIEDVSNEPINTTTTEEWDGKKMVKKTSTFFDFECEYIKSLFTFHVDKQNKDIILYSDNGSQLCYAITNKNGELELLYPEIKKEGKKDFYYSRKKNALSFWNKDTEYTITDKSGNAGISILTKGKTYQWTGNPKKREGSLAKLLKEAFDNVSYGN